MISYLLIKKSQQKNIRKKIRDRKKDKNRDRNYNRDRFEKKRLALKKR